MFRTIGACLRSGHDNSGGISRIDDPHPPPGTNVQSIDPKSWTGPWRSLTDPDKIGFLVCASNSQQYNQAESAPFGSGILASRLGDITTSAEAQALLSGALPIDSMNLLPETTAILKFLGIPYAKTLPPTRGIIHPSQFVDT